MKSTEVCVDASVAIKVVVAEAGSDKADALFHQWASEQTQLIAPVFFEVETDSIIRQKVSLRRELTVAQAQRAFASLKGLPIKTTHSPEQRERAWEIAREFEFPTVYDATYLALAELRRCEFWTADEKLFKQVRDKLTFVQWLGNYSPVR
jgi:predicted nucleic acid-binding protein